MVNRKLFAQTIITSVLLLSCAREPVDRLIADLDDPSQRDNAIDGLVTLVRKSPTAKRKDLQTRVVYALMEAYNEDFNRSDIIDALATLKDSTAEPIFMFALKDASRGGVYYDTAIRAAQAISDLSLKNSVPELVALLKKWHGSRSPEQNSWLERALIQTLDKLHDQRAVGVLIQVLKGNPLLQDFYLNKMAASALGHLENAQAIPPLVSSLMDASHGLLLFEESRQALCRFGQSGTSELMKAAAQRDKNNQPQVNAVAAARVLGDVAHPSVAPQIASLLKTTDPDEYRLMVQETLFRLGAKEGENELLALVENDKKTLSSRRQAAELLGWYGSNNILDESLEPLCSKTGTENKVLCWSVALAYSRVAGPNGLAQFNMLISSQTDPVTQNYLVNYRPRLEMIFTCKSDFNCLLERMFDKDWRIQERAALEIGRLEPKGAFLQKAILAMGDAFKKSEPQVQQAILMSLERLDLAPNISARLLSYLEQSKSVKEGDLILPALFSRTFCLRQRLIKKMDRT